MSKATDQEKLTRTEATRVSRMRFQSRNWGSEKDPRLTHPKTLDYLLKVIKE